MMFLELEFHDYCAYIIPTENFLKLQHIFSNGDPESAENIEDSYQNFVFKVVVGETTFQGKPVMAFDYLPEYKFINREDTVSSKIQKGDSSWALDMNEAISNYDKFGCIELCYSSSTNYNGDKNFIKLMATPASFADVKATIFPISEIVEGNAQYGYKIQIFNKNLDALMDERFTVIQKNSELLEAFNEIVVSAENDFEIKQEDNQSLVFYIEEADVTDLLYSEIIKRFGCKRYTEDESLFITKEWLSKFYKNFNIPLEDQVLRVDVGGEGLHYFPLTQCGDGVCQIASSTGFPNSINLNSQRNYSQISSLPISRLIEMDENWKRKFPFCKGTVDVFTFQGTPVPTYKNNYADEFKEIERCIASNGKISFWVSGNDLDAMFEFYEIYLSGQHSDGGCYTTVLDILNPRNVYEEFYLGFKPIILDSRIPKILKPNERFVIPIKVSIDESDKYLGMSDSARLDFVFLYDIYNSK